MSVKTMKQKILTIAKSENFKASHWINNRPFTKTILSLVGEDKDDFYTAYDELISEGVFETKGEEQFLTEKGENVLNKL